MWPSEPRFTTYCRHHRTWRRVKTNVTRYSPGLSRPQQRDNSQALAGAYPNRSLPVSPDFSFFLLTVPELESSGLVSKSIGNQLTGEAPGPRDEIVRMAFDELLAESESDVSHIYSYIGQFAQRPGAG